MRPDLPDPTEVQRRLAQHRRERTPTFEIRADARAIGGKTITCHLCGLTSYHPQDVQHRYCGHCHIFHEDVGP